MFSINGTILSAFGCQALVRSDVALDVTVSANWGDTEHTAVEAKSIVGWYQESQNSVGFVQVEV